MKTGVSVVIPAYNEEANVASCLTKVHSVLSAADWDWEIILVNDGSRDRTGVVARSCLKKIPNLRVVENRPNRGYGGALKRGFEASKKEFIAFVPADNQFDFSQIHEFVALQKETNADIVSGIRPNGGHDPWYRLVFRWGWNTVVRALFGFLASDIDCGFKLFRRSILKKVNLPSDGAMVDTQLFAGARARGLKIAEIPVTHLPRTAGKSTGGNPGVIVKAFRELVVFWWQLKQEIMVEEGRAVFRWEMLLIIAILFVAGFSRLWHIDRYLTFLGDEGRDVLVVKDIVEGRKFTLIGPGTSIGSMYLGPLYYYSMIAPLKLFALSPVGPAVQVAILGIFTVALIWWIGRQWFGRVPALAVALLYAVSPTAIIYSRSSLNPNVMPFFALITMYGVWKVWRLGYLRWLVISGISFAFVLNSHYLGLLLAPVIGLFWFLSRKKPGWKKYSLITAFSFLLLMSPLFFFDLRHNWINSRAVYDFFSRRQTTVNLKFYKAIPNIWPVFTEINTTLLAAKDESIGQLMSWFIVISAVAYLLPRVSRYPRRDMVFILVWMGAGLLGLGLYKQHIYDHYFGFLFPVPFFLLGFSLSLLFQKTLTKILGLVMVLLLVIFSLSRSPLLTPPNFQLDRTREVADFIKTESRGQPFNLGLISKSNYDAAYRYFLSLNSAPFYTIHQSLTEQLFVICENAECNPIGHPLW